MKSDHSLKNDDYLDFRHFKLNLRFCSKISSPHKRYRKILKYIYLVLNLAQNNWILQFFEKSILRTFTPIKRNGIAILSINTWLSYFRHLITVNFSKGNIFSLKEEYYALGGYAVSQRIEDNVIIQLLKKWKNKKIFKNLEKGGSQASWLSVTLSSRKNEKTLYPDQNSEKLLHLLLFSKLFRFRDFELRKRHLSFRSSDKQNQSCISKKKAQSHTQTTLQLCISQRMVEQ